MLTNKYRCFGEASVSLLRVYKIQQQMLGRQWKEIRPKRLGQLTNIQYTASYSRRLDMLAGGSGRNLFPLQRRYRQEVCGLSVGSVLRTSR